MLNADAHVCVSSAWFWHRGRSDVIAAFQPRMMDAPSELSGDTQLDSTDVKRLLYATGEG